MEYMSKQGIVRISTIFLEDVSLMSFVNDNARIIKHIKNTNNSHIDLFLVEHESIEQLESHTQIPIYNAIVKNGLSGFEAITFEKCNYLNLAE